MAAPEPLDFKKLRVFPLEQRTSLATIEETLVALERPLAPCSEANLAGIRDAAERIRFARAHGAGVILIYGAHLLKNGGHLILDRLISRGWVTHLATNGAGIIHDWEWAFLGRSTESVEKNVATGTFGAWDETGRNIHLALLAGALCGEGFGRSLGRFILEDGVRLPAMESLEHELRTAPAHPLAPARAEILQAMHSHNLAPGRVTAAHPWKATSLLAKAFALNVPLTVHPGIGYDIISNHPMFNGAVLGRAATVDFRQFGAAVEQLDGGTVLSIGSAIMGPQVFEKSLSCVNNLRLQAGRAIVRDHSIFVVDLQDGGGWDWSKGEPPKENPAYYLRFCKSFSRMGGAMRYLQCDNVAFIQRLLHELENG